MTILQHKPYFVKVATKRVGGGQKCPKLWPRGFWMTPVNGYAIIMKISNRCAFCTPKYQFIKLKILCTFQGESTKAKQTFKPKVFGTRTVSAVKDHQKTMYCTLCSAVRTLFYYYFYYSDSKLYIDKMWIENIMSNFFAPVVQKNYEKIFNRRGYNYLILA